MSSLPLIICRPPKSHQPDDRLRPNECILLDGHVYYPPTEMVGRAVTIQFVEDKGQRQAYAGKFRWYKVLSWTENGKATLLPLMQTESGYVYSFDGNHCIPGHLEVDASLPIEERESNQIVAPFIDRISDCLEASRDDSKFESLKSKATECLSTGYVTMPSFGQSRNGAKISVQNATRLSASSRLDTVPVEVLIEIARWLDPASQRSLKAVSERSNIVYGRVLCIKAIVFENTKSWAVKHIKLCDPEEGDLDVCCHRELGASENALPTRPPCWHCYDKPEFPTQHMDPVGVSSTS